MKKIIIALIILLALIIGLNYYKNQETIECWWTVMYPPFGYDAIQEEKIIETSSTEISSSNPDYFYIEEEEKPITIKMAILEWFEKHFRI